MYARGMTAREIQGYLAEMYATEVSAEFISKVTEEVSAEVTAWQNRPLEPMYPVVFFDARRVKIRDEGVVRNKAVYLALGVLPDGGRDVLGLWIEQTEGSKFWLKVFNELKSRGVNDILIAVVDGLKGLAEAIETAVPQTTVQTCIVHLIRNSLDYASWKHRRAVAAALRPIYKAATAEAAQQELEDFERGDWGEKYPTIVQSWKRAWQHVIPFFAFPPLVRRVIYTTNVIESLHMQLRKIIKKRTLPERRSGDQAPVARPSQHHGQEAKINPRVGRPHESICRRVRRSLHQARVKSNPPRTQKIGHAPALLNTNPNVPKYSETGRMLVDRVREAGEEVGIDLMADERLWKHREGIAGEDDLQGSARGGGFDDRRGVSRPASANARSRLERTGTGPNRVLIWHAHAAYMLHTPLAQTAVQLRIRNRCGLKSNWSTIA